MECEPLHHEIPTEVPEWLSNWAVLHGLTVALLRPDSEENDHGDVAFWRFIRVSSGSHLDLRTWRGLDQIKERLAGNWPELFP